MNQDKTIVYYTANAENPVFEQRILTDLKKKAGDIPIIIVSRKPIYEYGAGDLFHSGCSTQITGDGLSITDGPLGTNICVGEQPISYTSEWKQLLIGLKAAKTKYVIAAEADCLYPPEYFTFTPTEENMMYNYNNIIMVWKYKGGFYQKRGYCEGAQMCDREYWIKQLEPLLPNDWTPYSRIAENMLVVNIFPERREFTGAAVISFKTRDGVSNRTTFVNKKIMELPYWGTITEVKKIFV
jgi:hypothetical protein